jgi:membrane protease YdiL (CAAX protease family)
MNGFISRTAGFIRRERIYIFLLAFIVFFHLFFMFLEGVLGKGDDHLAGGGLISNEEILEAASSNPIIYFIFLFLIGLFLLFAVTGIAFDIVYLYLSHKKRTPVERTQSVKTGLWGFWDICKVAIIFLFAQRAIWLADAFVFARILYPGMTRTMRLMLSATLTDLIAIAAILHFVLNEKGQDAATLGLTAKRFLLNVKYGICAYIGLAPVLASVMLLTIWLFDLFNIPVEPQEILVILQREKHIPTLIYMGFFTAFLGPVLEEVFFRGFAYSVFRKRFGVFAGIRTRQAFFLYSAWGSYWPIYTKGRGALSRR